jgi:hypothetical protein
LIFLYVTVSTLNPTVGIVVTDWPNFSLYNTAVNDCYAYFLSVILSNKHYLLVLPAASNPSINIRISFLPKIFDNILPIIWLQTPLRLNRQIVLSIHLFIGFYLPTFCNPNICFDLQIYIFLKSNTDIHHIYSCILHQLWCIIKWGWRSREKERKKQPPFVIFNW